jgi:RNA polymerase sigma-70 factor (ECF subfamily)
MVGVGADGETFERWYRSEHPRLMAAVTVAAGSRELAQDVVSEAFARAFERWERVSIMESPSGWVRQVAVNVMRRRFRRAALEERLLRRERRPDAEPPSYAIQPELWAAVAALPSRQRAVVALRIVLDLSQEETASLLGIRPGTVSAALTAARRTVANELAQEVEHA